MGSKSRNRALFEAYLQFTAKGECGMTENESLGLFLNRVYETHMWTEYLDTDLQLLCNQQLITDLASLRQAIQVGYGYELGLPAIVIDAISKELNPSTKYQFPIFEKNGFEELFRKYGAILSHERINRLNDLKLILVEGWKHIKLPIGIKLSMEKAALPSCMQPDLNISSSTRITIRSTDGEVYTCDRYCPHKGADLTGALITGTVLTCPKHRWRFDLAQNGKCINGGPSNHTLNARLLEW